MAENNNVLVRMDASDLVELQFMKAVAITTTVVAAVAVGYIAIEKKAAIKEKARRLRLAWAMSK